MCSSLGVSSGCDDQRSGIASTCSWSSSVPASASCPRGGGCGRSLDSEAVPGHTRRGQPGEGGTLHGTCHAGVRRCGRTVQSPRRRDAIRHSVVEDSVVRGAQVQGGRSRPNRGTRIPRDGPAIYPNRESGRRRWTGSGGGGRGGDLSLDHRPTRRRMLASDPLMSPHMPPRTETASPSFACVQSAPLRGALRL